MFKVVVDDTEYEIVARTDYIKFLEKEIERIKKAMTSYNKMMATRSNEKKEYLRQEIKYYLKPHEEPEKLPEILSEFRSGIKARTEHVAKLYRESKQIKKLVI